MENQKKTDEFDLEDILKEFHEEPQEDVRLWEDDAAPSPRQDTARDTVPLEEITKAVRREHAPEETVVFSPITDDTAVFSPVSRDAVPVGDDTVAFTPVTEDTAVIPPIQEEAAKPDSPEPYSQNWEPEYEMPMGEYIPPEPIVFRPKSRLGELKRKLIAGPERRYYELTEQGLGKLQLAILCNLVVFLLTAAVTAMYSFGMIGQGRIRLVVFAQFLSLLLSALFGSYQLMEGVADLFKLRFSLNSLLVFSLVACVADGVLCLQQVRIPCCASFSLNMTMALWSAYQKRNTELGQMDTMRKAIRLDSVVFAADYYEGRPGFLRSEGQVEDFMDTYDASSGVQKTMNIYAFVALLLSLAIGITAGVRHGLELGIQAAAAALLVAVPATGFVALSRPMAVLERRLHKLGTVLCGWQGVKKLAKSGVFPVNDGDLFPGGSVKLNGVKFYGKRNPDQVVAYAAALMQHCGSTIAPLFSQLLESRNGYHYETDQLRAYPGGIGAGVNEEAVLAGTLQFMQDMGVDMPEGTRVNQAIYLAIDGELAGVFAITYGKTKMSSAGLTTLCAYRRLTPVLTSSDFMLTESFLRSRFGVNTRRIAFPSRQVRQELMEKPLPEDAPALALTTREGLAGAAFAVTGARALRTACRAGVAVHMLGGILGLAMMAVLAIVGAQELLTPMNVLVYELIWFLPGLLITEWTRAV